MLKDNEPEIIDLIHQFAHRQERGEYILTFTEQEVARLRQILSRGLSGSYYRSGERISGADIDAVFDQDTAEFTVERLEEIAHFYEIGLDELLENLTRDDYCESFLEARRYPYEDPW
jgi:hypothetical protein